LIVRSFLGVLLLTAAALKIYGLWSGTSPEEGPLATPQLQIATIEIEVILGLWMLSGQWAIAAWVAAVAWFAVLAVASLYMGLEGQADCGCLGPKVHVSPWWMFGFHLAAVGALAASRPRNANVNATSTRIAPVIRVMAGTALLVALIAGGFLFATDDPESALALLRGDCVTVEPAISQLGEGHRGEFRTFAIELRNYSDRPCCVFGGTTNCQCISSNDLPATIPAHGTRQLHVIARFSGASGQFLRRFILHVDDGEDGVVVARFRGRVIEPAPE
jgi:hypothetical protein